jgi:hypothetical protein
VPGGFAQLPPLGAAPPDPRKLCRVFKNIMKMLSYEKIETKVEKREKRQKRQKSENHTNSVLFVYIEASFFGFINKLRFCTIFVYFDFIDLNICINGY